MIALVGGTVCDPSQGLNAPSDLYLGEDGRVAAVLPCGAVPPAGRWLRRDCAGLLVLPGPVDSLCLLPPAAEAWREDAASLAAAAAAAGYTSVLVHTGSADPAAVAAVAALDLPVRLLPVAALTSGGHLADLGRLAAAGAVACSDWPAPLADAGLMARALRSAGALGLPLIVHPEDPALAAGGVMHEGALSFAMGLRGVPAVAETVAVCRDAVLQRALGGRLHFAALSTAESLPHLGAGSGAVTAHHLLLTERAVRGYRTEAKLSPPLRGEADRLALLEAVRSGRLSLASGHRPVPPEAKACEYDYAEFGASALETALPAALGVLGAEALAIAASALPARTFGLPGGTLRPGAPADVAVFDPRAEWEVCPEALLSRGRSTPLAGRRLRGRAVLTVVGGRIVAEAASTPA